MCTVALGLGLVTVAFTVLNALLFRVDAVPAVHEMFAVARARTSEAQPRAFTRAEFDALRRDTSVFRDAYAELRDVDSVVNGRLMWGTFVTGNAFQVLGVNAARGRALTPIDDELAGQPVMVLSHRGWDRLFARDPAVLGRHVLINDVAFEIVGVMPEGFRGLTLSPDDYWAPLAMVGHVRPTYRGREAGLGVDIVGRLKPGVSREAAIAQLGSWQASTPGRAIAPSPAPALRDRPERTASALTLVPRRGTVDQPLEAVPITAPLFFSFGLILLIGCANVANLLLARAVSRQREIGIRLSLGAPRRRIIRQLLTEGLLMALAAAAAGYGISRVVLQVVVDAMMTTLPPDIGDVRLLVPAADWRVLLFLVAGAGASTLAFALAPALQATRVEPNQTIRGELLKDARPGRARNILIGVQVSAAALLLICSAVFLRSAFTSATFDSGLRTSDTVLIQIVNDAARDAIVQAVAAEPSVASVAAAWPDLSLRSALADSGVAASKVGYKLVSPEYFGVLGIAVVRGRGFAPAERTSNLSVALISETAARALWPNADAVGQAFRLDPDPASAPGGDGPVLEARTLTVAGVVRDVPGLRIAPLDKAAVYVPGDAAMTKSSLIARVHGEPELARQTLANRLTSVDPDMGRQVLTLRTLARIDTYFLQVAFWLTIVLGGLALALTLSGLFSVLSYLVAQRAREIGVRMALGATARDVTRLVLAQAIRPVGIGILVGGGSAAGLAAVLLATPMAEGIGTVVNLLDPVAYAVSLFAIVAACLAAASIPAARAARLDPTRTLRQD